MTPQEKLESILDMGWLEKSHIWNISDSSAPADRLHALFEASSTYLYRRDNREIVQAIGQAYDLPALTDLGKDPEFAKNFQTALKTNKSFRNLINQAGDANSPDTGSLSAMMESASPEQMKQVMTRLASGQLNLTPQGELQIPGGEKLQADMSALQGKPMEAFSLLEKTAAAIGDPGMIDVFASIRRMKDQESQRQLREAIGNAATYNPKFLPYIAGAEGASGMLSPEILNDPNKVNLVCDILNSVANNPDYDLGRIAAVGQNVQALGELEKKQLALETQQKELREKHAALLKSGSASGQQIADSQLAMDGVALSIEENFKERDLANRRLIKSVRHAGANVPALAGLNGPMIMQFFGELCSRGPDCALGNLIANLDMDIGQMRSFRDLMGPITNMMQFMGQPYADYFAYYGPEFQKWGEKLGADINTVVGGKRVQVNPKQPPAANPIAFQTPATGAEPEVTVNGGSSLADGAFAEAVANVIPAKLTPDPTMKVVDPALQRPSANVSQYNLAIG